MALFGINDLRHHTSAFLRENFNRARLILTDVSHIQLLTEKVTSADSRGPDIKTMAAISEAAFNFHEFQKIVQVLHDRLDTNVKRTWKQLDNTLFVLEYLLIHGPISLSDEFRSNTISIKNLCNYNIIENGIDRGIYIRRKAENILEFLAKTDRRKDKENNFVHGFIGSHKRPMQHIMVTHAKPESEALVLDPTGDMESLSLLSTSLYEEEEMKEVSRDNHQTLFRQVTSLSSNFVSDDSDSISGEKSGMLSDNSSVRCKNFSSPACFRDISNLNWQHANNVKKRGTEMITDLKDGASSRNQPQMTKTEQKSTMKFSGHAMSGKGSSCIDRKTLTEQQNVKLDGRAGNDLISEGKQFAHQAECLKLSKIPLLAPPPQPGFRTRYQNRLQKEN